MADMVNNLQVPLAGWTVPRPTFRRIEELNRPGYDAVAGEWASSTAYIKDDIVANSGRNYTCATSGTSASTGGPTGTGAGISDGSAVWSYLGDQWPVFLSDLKAHLRITHEADDHYLQNWVIPAATEMVEEYLNRRLISRRVRLWMDFLPGTGNEYTLYGAGTAQVPVRYANVGMFRWFDLWGAPAGTIESLNYIDNAGQSNVFPASLYLTDNHDPDMAGRVILQRGAVWPTDLQVAVALNVIYSVGYGQAAVVPRQLRQGVMLVAAAMWSNRGDNADAGAEILDLPAVRSLLHPMRRMRVTTL